MEKNARSSSLGEFLRARRERISPEEAGLPSYGRRRTPGLRREEVAQLAHIGTSWYTSLEQGREVRPSGQVIESLAEALQLSDDERRHLKRLAGLPESKDELSERAISAGLERTIMGMEPSPAFLLGRGWHLLMWNRAAEAVFRLPAYAEGLERNPNWLKRFLIDSSLRKDNKDWEAKAKVMIAQFRADHAHCLHDAAIHKLVNELSRESELFRDTWPRHDVQIVTDCHKRWKDSVLGELEFEHVVLHQSNQPEQKLMIYTASPATAERLASMLGGSVEPEINADSKG